MTPVVEAEDLSVRYGGRDAVRRVTFSVAEGDLLGIVGPNGAGKTTLFRAVLGLMPASSGRARLFGLEGARRRGAAPLVGYVQQGVRFDRGFPATVGDVVGMGVPGRRASRRAYALAAGAGVRGAAAGPPEQPPGGHVAAALEVTGTSELRGRRIGELSGGELQRVLIAKALAGGPLLMVLDEPAVGVDAASRDAFYSAVRRINGEMGVTIVWSSHDLAAVREHAATVACMDRTMAFHGPAAEFFADEDLVGAFSESSMQAHMRAHAGWGGGSGD